MTENKRFVKVYCCGDTGLLDKEKEEWFVENLNSIFDLERNWNDVLDKLNEVADENEELKQRINSRLHFYRELLYERTNDNVVKRVVEDLEDILR